RSPRPSFPCMRTGAPHPTQQIRWGVPGAPPLPQVSRTPHPDVPGAQPRAARLGCMTTAPLIRVRIGCVERSGPLTPYLVELIVDDVRRQRPGAPVEI